MKYVVASFAVLAIFSQPVFSQAGSPPKVDEFTDNGHTLRVHFYGHGTLMLDYDNVIIHVDPVSAYVPKDAPQADIILVTHEHGDHLDAARIAKLTKDGTELVTNPAVAGKLKKGLAMKNGESRTVKGIKIEAVPAYNTTKGREGFHPRGRDNGYILTLGKKRVYIAGDTEDIPEMAALKDIDIAFLPVNQPYTMTPAQAARAAAMFHPAVLYPYHFGSTNRKELEARLKQVKGVDVRIRDLK